MFDGNPTNREGQELVRYTDDLYGRVGRNLGRAFWDYYKVSSQNVNK
jgi:hypothetical protein